MSIERLRKHKAASPGRLSNIAERRDEIAAAELVLKNALTERAPACDRDDRFTAEARDLVTTLTLGPLCDSCPIAQACASYAKVARPETGFWAGEWHGRQERDARLEERRQRVGSARKLSELAQECVHSEGPDFPDEEVVREEKIA